MKTSEPHQIWDFVDMSDGAGQQVVLVYTCLQESLCLDINTSCSI